MDLSPGEPTILSVEPTARVRFVDADAGRDALLAAGRDPDTDVVVLRDRDVVLSDRDLDRLVAPLKGDPADPAGDRADSSTEGAADVVVGARAGSAYRRFIAYLFGVGDTRHETVAVRAAALPALLENISRRPAYLGTELAMRARHAGLRVAGLGLGTAPPSTPRPEWRYLWALIRATHAIVTGVVGPEKAKPPQSVVLMKFTLFGIVGALSGVLYVLVYLPLREFSSPAVSNFVALVAAALFNIELNRVWTFRRTAVARIGMHVRSAILFVIHYVLTTAPVMVLLMIDPDASRTAEVVVLLTFDLLMTIARFIGLDKWVFRHRAA